jgi:hypothetical protein
VTSQRNGDRRIGLTPGAAQARHDQLNFFRRENRRLQARVKELKSLPSYRLAAPVRAIERLVSSVRKRFAATRRGREAGIDGVFQAGQEPALAPNGLESGIDEVSYARWIEKYDTLTDANAAAIKADVASFRRHPLVSVLVLPGFEGEDGAQSLLSATRGRRPHSMD